MIITVVIATLMYGLILLRSRPDASMFTSSLVVTYCLYLEWSAFSSDNSGDNCNPFAVGSSSGKNYTANTILMMIIGLLFAWSSLLVIAAITKRDDEMTMATEMNAAIITDEKDEAAPVNDVEENNVKKTAKEMHVFPITSETIVF